MRSQLPGHPSATASCPDSASNPTATSWPPSTDRKTDNPTTLRAILRELAEITRHGWPVIMPNHPPTAEAVRQARCADLLTHLHVVDPMPHRTFLAAARHAALLISDSGGLQEEVTVLKRPLIVVRRSTERPEATSEFATLVPAGRPIAQVARTWLATIDARLTTLAATPSPYGDGSAGQHIADRTLQLTGDH